jgi:hypothetical protein
MKKLIKSKLFLQVIVASMVATLATAGIVAATTTTIGQNISTTGTLTVTGASTLGSVLFDTASSTAGGTASLRTGTLLATGALQATSLTDGTATLTGGALTGLTTALTAAQGGTGWATINANTLLLGNGSNPIATTSAGTNGNILVLSAGTPKWVATSTTLFSSPTFTGTAIFANASSTLASFGSTGTTVAGLMHGTCANVTATVTASSTASFTCAVTGMDTTWKVFVSPYITDTNMIFTSASTTATGFQVSVYNTGVIANTTLTSHSWQWMAIK